VIVYGFYGYGPLPTESVQAALERNGRLRIALAGTIQTQTVIITPLLVFLLDVVGMPHQQPKQGN
jgi:hypothetical protein